MSTNAAVIVAVVALAFGAGLGWLLRGEPEAPSPDVITVRDGVGADSEEPSLEADPAAAAARIAELETKLETVVAERDELQKSLAAAGIPEGGAATEGERVARALKLKGARFVYEGMEKTLDDMQWQTIATAIASMVPQLNELGENLAAGKGAGDLPMQIQKHNVPLIQAAVAASQGGMPGYGINGAFTHPALVANMIFSTLLEAGEALSESQTERLGQIADRFVAEDAALRAEVPVNREKPFALAALVAESEMKDRFYKSVDEILTPAQLDILHPPTLRDRTAGDIFSAGLIWMQSAQVARVKNAAELSERLTEGLMRKFQIPEEEKEAVGRAVGDWAAKFGPATFTPLDALEKNNMVKMDRIRAAGRPMVELYKELVRSLPAQEAVADRLRTTTFLVVPAGQ